MSEIGTHERKVELLRNALKKAGHDVVVKLLPSDVSKGDGNGVVITVTEADEGVVVVDVAFSVDDEGSVVVVSNGSLSSRLSIPNVGLGGAGLVSVCIKPLTACRVAKSDFAKLGSI